MEVSDQLHASATLYHQEKSPLYPLDIRLGGSQSPSGYWAIPIHLVYYHINSYFKYIADAWLPNICHHLLTTLSYRHVSSYIKGLWNILRRSACVAEHGTSTDLPRPVVGHQTLKTLATGVCHFYVPIVDFNIINTTISNNLFGRNVTFHF
jgi:hypothetical protein